MKQDKFEKFTKSIKFKYFFFLILYISLLISFFLGEDSTGGAFLDYSNHKHIITAFIKDFKSTILNYDNYQTRHSPILIIFLSSLEKINLTDTIIRLIHLHLCLILPLTFYLILKYKYKKYSDNLFILLTGLIFLSPTFRSLSVWPDSRLLGLVFFLLSIYFFLKFLDDRKFNNCVLNIIFCAISSYISPNFSLFSIFFFYKFTREYGFYSTKIINIILLNFLLSAPAIYYLFILDINFLNQSAVPNFDSTNIFFKNFSNQILIIPTIIFFYILPFALLKILKINKKFSFNKFIISVLIFTISLFFFDYEFSFTGGGIFFKLSNLLFNNNILFYFISLLSIYIIISYFSEKFENVLLLLIIFLSNPQITIYHKYYDPLIFILIFSLFILNIKIENILKFKKIILIYLYLFLFLLVSNLKFLWTI